MVGLLKVGAVAAMAQFLLSMASYSSADAQTAIHSPDTGMESRPRLAETIPPFDSSWLSEKGQLDN